jgi:hypothetical protein
LAFVVRRLAASIHARGGLTSGFLGSLSCKARAWRFPRGPTLLDMTDTSGTKERADTRWPLVSHFPIARWVAAAYKANPRPFLTQQTAFARQGRGKLRLVIREGRWKPKLRGMSMARDLAHAMTFGREASERSHRMGPPGRPFGAPRTRPSCLALGLDFFKNRALRFSEKNSRRRAA